ncbi:hypothetical protein EXW39_29160 (plasmid) [Bacillus mycoides]|uniref:hypothetical protein n=1 Tax=Bacillus mycoides TaxID=1405 RepID=UPI001C010F8E|nr:hypothetical protein [Bacillus mycoides]QWH64154.1 hypothetical protein EXW39_29160 [Bacillus mycoides]
MSEVVNFSVDQDMNILGILDRLKSDEIKGDKALLLSFKEALECIKKASLDDLKNKAYSLSDFLFHATNIINIFKDERYESPRVFTVCHLSNLTAVWKAMKNNDEEEIKDILISIINDEKTNELFFPFYREIILMMFN